MFALVLYVIRMHCLKRCLKLQTTRGSTASEEHDPSGAFVARTTTTITPTTTTISSITNVLLYAAATMTVLPLCTSACLRRAALCSHPINASRSSCRKPILSARPASTRETRTPVPAFACHRQEAQNQRRAAGTHHDLQ